VAGFPLAKGREKGEARVCTLCEGESVKWIGDENEISLFEFLLKTPVPWHWAAFVVFTFFLIQITLSFCDLTCR